MKKTYFLIVLVPMLGACGPASESGFVTTFRHRMDVLSALIGGAEIDWGDPARRSAQLTTLVTDSEAALELAIEQINDPEIRSLDWMISKIMGDDVERTPPGDCKIRKGVAPDRFISLYDPEMRHGRKSVSKKFDGFKVSTIC